MYSTTTKARASPKMSDVAMCDKALPQPRLKVWIPMRRISERSLSLLIACDIGMAEGLVLGLYMGWLLLIFPLMVLNFVNFYCLCAPKQWTSGMFGGWTSHQFDEGRWRGGRWRIHQHQRDRCRSDGEVFISGGCRVGNRPIMVSWASSWDMKSTSFFDVRKIIRRWW